MATCPQRPGHELHDSSRIRHIARPVLLGLDLPAAILFCQDLMPAATPCRWAAGWVSWKHPRRPVTCDSPALDHSHGPYFLLVCGGVVAKTNSPPEPEPQRRCVSQAGGIPLKFASSPLVALGRRLAREPGGTNPVAAWGQSMSNMGVEPTANTQPRGARVALLLTQLEGRGRQLYHGNFHCYWLPWLFS